MLKLDTPLRCRLFDGISQEQLPEMLHCLQAWTAEFEKGEILCPAGEPVGFLGVVLSGSVSIESGDVWGNRSILGKLGPGEVFAEAYACVPDTPLLVSVAAQEKTKILCLEMERVLTSCPNSCAHHRRLVRNLLQVTAEKNLELTRKISYTSPKSIRGRLLSYLSDQAILQGSRQFAIPFDRQQLADYLGVERSALSKELGKMRREGILQTEKNRFWLKEPLEQGSQTKRGEKNR